MQIRLDIVTKREMHCWLTYETHSRLAAILTRVESLKSAANATRARLNARRMQLQKFSDNRKSSAIFVQMCLA